MHGLYVLWWVRERHVPVAAVAAILAAGDLAVTVLEIPTGWLADRYGHRASLIAGSLLQVGGMLLAWVGRGIPGVLTSCLLIAAGDAFRSGADQALLYRSCVALGEPAFQTIEARARGLQLAALVALVLAGGAIVDTWGFEAGWLSETVMCAIGLAIAHAMVEPPAHNGDIPSGPCSTSAGTARSDGSSSARRVKSVVALILPAAILTSVASAATFYVQSSATVEPMRMTAFVAIVTLAEAAGSLVGAHVTCSVRAQLLLVVLGIVLTIGGGVFPSTFLPAVISLCFLMGMAHPLRAAALQRVAADGMRARVASLASACDKMFATAALVFAGLAAR
jgi:hypothetical protein